MPNQPIDTSTERRRFLRLFATAAVVLPVAVLSGCSDDASAPVATTQPQSPSPPQTDSSAAEASMPQAAEQTASAEQAATAAPQQAARGSAKLPKLSPDNPSAQALGYQHDAANVDLRNYPQRAKPEAANQYCHNCALFQGNPDDAWGLCALFPDKLISSNGWCSGYAPQQT